MKKGGRVENVFCFYVSVMLLLIVCWSSCSIEIAVGVWTRREKCSLRRNKITCRMEGRGV